MGALRYGPFNSIKVQLRLLEKTERETADGAFNSIKVQLRLVTMDDPSNKGFFQFHKGTIKTVSISVIDNVTVLSIP